MIGAQRMLTLTSSHKTWAHNLPAAAKLVTLTLATAGLLALNHSAPLILAALATLALTASAGRDFLRAALRPLWMLWPFVTIVAAWHIWLHDPAGITIVLRVITSVALANFVTMTTRLEDMITVITWVLRPVSRVIPPARLALAIALTIRFIPVMLLRADDLTRAWRARSPKRPRWRILPALALAALDDSARVAEALRARGGVD